MVQKKGAVNFKWEKRKKINQRKLKRTKPMHKYTNRKN